MRKEILVNGKKIVYFEEGRGQTFLVLHGLAPKPIRDFLKFQRILSDKGYRVILLSLPGFEENGNTNASCLSEWVMEDYLNCISSFMDELGLREFFLIGHSLGGAIAIRLAVLHARSIKMLFLISPGIIRPIKSCPWKRWLLCIALCIILVTARLVSKDKMYNILMRILATEDTACHLFKIKQPTIVFWGKRYYNYYLFGRGFAERIPNHVIKVISGVGHSIQRDVPDKAVELIVDFIKKQES